MSTNSSKIVARKRGPRNRKGYAAGPWAKRFRVYGRAGAQLVKDVSSLKQLINTEFKFFDVDESGVYDVPDTGVMYHLNHPGKGDEANQRDGSTIRLKSIELTYQVKYDPTAANSTIRSMIILDKQPNAAQPTLSQILASAASVTGVLSPRNLYFKKRFVILHDQRICLSAYDNPDYFVHFYKKLDMHTEFNTSTTGTYADVNTNSIWFVQLSDKGVNYPKSIMYSRIRYLDN